MSESNSVEHIALSLAARQWWHALLSSHFNHAHVI